ncbi:MAG: GGDEF domain-containing response regulator [Cellvibrionaceae bacterium]
MSTVNNHKIRVLVIDDSSTVRIAASRIFGNEFDVLLAVDGEDGLDVIESDPHIQVVFTDLVMPEMDGFELLKNLRTHSNDHISNLPVIVMTGAENPEIAKQKAFSLGATDFITKPFGATDIRARARSYAQLNLTTKALREQTTIDDLTGLLNRRGFDKQLDKEIAFVSRHQYYLSVMSVEIDNYKDLFISMGRSSTEKIIKSIAQALQKTLRKEDTIARAGLARFTVSMPLVERDNALEMANKICQTVESFKAKLKGKRLPLTVSAGVASFEPGDEMTPDTIIDMTDIALGKASELGASQLYLMGIADYVGSHHKNGKSLSIDTLLEKVSMGEDIVIADQLDAALDHLAPLFSLLSNEQKQRILSYRE